MSKKLLLADDSITIQKVISLTLAAEDYDIIVANDGDTAIAKAKEEKPDLILADVAMPGKNGYEVCEAIKNDPELGSIPVILLAGTFDPLDEDKATQVGADDNISKPFESEELINKLKTLLPATEEPQKTAEEIFEAAKAAEPEVPEIIEELEAIPIVEAVEEATEAEIAEEKPPVPDELWQTSDLMAGPIASTSDIEDMDSNDLDLGLDETPEEGGADEFFDLSSVTETTPPVDEPPAEPTPTFEPPVEVAEPPAPTPPVEEPPAEPTPTFEPPVEVAEPPAAAPPVEEPPAEPAPTFEPMVPPVEAAPPVVEPPVEPTPTFEPMVPPVEATPPVEVAEPPAAPPTFEPMVPPVEAAPPVVEPPVEPTPTFETPIEAAEPPVEVAEPPAAPPTFEPMVPPVETAPPVAQPPVEPTPTFEPPVEAPAPPVTEPPVEPSAPPITETTPAAAVTEAPPQQPPPGAGISIEQRIRESVSQKLNQQGLDMATMEQDKLEQILTQVARDVIEEIAWEVVPEIAEEIIKKELVDKIKAAMSS